MIRRSLVTLIFAVISVSGIAQMEEQAILKFAKGENNLRSICFFLECQTSFIETINIDTIKLEKNFAISLMDEPLHFLDFKSIEKNESIDSRILSYKAGIIRLYYWKKEEHLYGIICRSSLKEADFIRDIDLMSMMTRFYIIDLNPISD